MCCEYNVLICLLQKAKFPFKGTLTGNISCLVWRLCPSRRFVRVTFARHSPAQLTLFPASYPIGFVNLIVNGNQGARMLTPGLVARWEAFPATSEPSGEARTFSTECPRRG
jgi:hypothetical protein